MTLDEAIKHCEEVAEEQNKLCERCDRASGYSRSHNEAIRTNDAKKHEKCGQEHIQLTGWLRELKQLRQRTSWIPVSESLPALDEDGYSIYVLVSFGLLTQTGIGQCREIDGQVHWYLGDDAKAIENYGVHVNAWMPLPEPYIESEGEE